MSLSLSMSLASPTSFLFLRCSPSSLPCLLQQKIQHRHTSACVLCIPLYVGSGSKPPHAREQIKKWSKSKKKKKIMHVCQMLRSKHWLLKVTSQPCKHTPLNHESNASPHVSLYILSSPSHLSLCISTPASNFFFHPSFSPFPLSFLPSYNLHLLGTTDQEVLGRQTGYLQKEQGWNEKEWSGSHPRLTYSARVC